MYETHWRCALPFSDSHRYVYFEIFASHLIWLNWISITCISCENFNRKSDLKRDKQGGTSHVLIWVSNEWKIEKIWLLNAKWNFGLSTNRILVIENYKRCYSFGERRQYAFTCWFSDRIRVKYFKRCNVNLKTRKGDPNNGLMEYSFAFVKYAVRKFQL